MTQVVKRRLVDLRMNEMNPRNNAEAVPFVRKSIEDYGYKVFIVIDQDNIIWAGHTRYQALWGINRDTGEYAEIDCILIDDLTDEQKKQFMIVDNQVAAHATFDFMKLEIILEDLGDDFNISDFGDIRGFRDIEIAPEDAVVEPEIKQGKTMVVIGSDKFEWDEASYHRWASHVNNDHGSGIMEWVISRLEIDEADWTFPNTEPEV